ncbi:MAG TPA: phage/plasmid primase, P4 family [Hyphomicrobium sp.]|nr:phage/plasmid primase, P4 family [Hyphomicrobium sp.]
MSGLGDAIEFLKAFHPKGPWVITAINPEEGPDRIRTQTFGPSTVGDAERFLAEWNGKWNLYFTGNRIGRRMSKKPERTDIVSLDHLHVDIDPRTWSADTGLTKEDYLTQEQNRIHALLTDKLPPGIPRPTLVVSTGGGYQAFWRLKEPLTLDGTLERAEEAKLWNVQLERIFKADSCHNIDRIMRLPGTWNVPSKKKLEKGRRRTMATVIDVDWSRDYSLSEFKPAPSTSAGAPLWDISPTVIDDVVTPIQSLDALDRWQVPPRIKVIIEQGRHPQESNKPNDDRSRWVFDVVCGLVRCEVPDTTIFAILTDARFKISERVLEQKNARKYVEKEIVSAKKAVASDAVNRESDEPQGDKPTWRQLAIAFISAQKQKLLRFGGRWFSYRSGAYQEKDDEIIRSRVYDRFPKFGSGQVSNLLDAAKGLVLRDASEFAPPCWLDGREGSDPRELLVVRNGMVDMRTGELIPHDPELFTFNALDYDYDQDAAAPERWLKFIREVFHEDSVQLVQQICGYLLTPDTSRQAIFVFVGAAGSGKSTLGRVLHSILGNRNVCSPSLSGLGTQFGQQLLIGKQLALISEMKLDHHDNKEAIARVLLNVSGEDPVSIPRKNLTDWEGRLGVRFVILANAPPSLNDSSGALLRRYVVIEMPFSFVGKEDPQLEAKLMAERSGILKWMIEGRRNMPIKFTTPSSSSEIVSSIDRLGAPVKAFVEDRCILDAEASCTKDELYKVYAQWHADSEQPAAMKFSKERFSGRLLEALGHRVRSKQPSLKKGEAKRPSRVWTGIRPLTPAELTRRDWEDKRDEVPF